MEMNVIDVHLKELGGHLKELDNYPNDNPAASLI